MINNNHHMMFMMMMMMGKYGILIENFFQTFVIYQKIYIVVNSDRLINFITCE